MAKTKKVKWALGGSEPDDLAEFKDNDQIIKEHTTGKGKSAEVNWPPRGSQVRCLVRQIKVKSNKNGDDMLSVMLVIDDPKKSELASWNNYAMFTNFNVTEQSAPYIKKFMKAMGASWGDFKERSTQDDQDPPHILQIGKVKIEGGSKPAHVMTRIKVKPGDEYHDGQEFLDPAGYVIPEGSEDAADDGDDAASESFEKPAKKGKDKGKKKGKGKKGKDEPPF